MASVTRGSYPHPVLDTSDDVASSIELFNVSVTPTVEDVELKFQVRMTDPDIKALIDAGRARYNFRWKCSSTIDSGLLSEPRTVQYADSTGYTGWVDQQRIRRTVRVEVTIIAAEEIPDYQLTAQHPDYGGSSFHLQSGDVIADGGYFEFEPDKLYDPLKPPVGSCFRFVSNAKLRKGIEVRFHDDEYVIVEFPPESLVGFGALRAHPGLQVSLVVLPALMQTISFVKDNVDGVSSDEDLSDKLWFKAITDLVAGVGSLEDPAFTLAQKILAHPLDASLFHSLDASEDE